MEPRGEGGGVRGSWGHGEAGVPMFHRRRAGQATGRRGLQGACTVSRAHARLSGGRGAAGSVWVRHTHATGTMEVLCTLRNRLQAPSPATLEPCTLQPQEVSPRQTRVRGQMGGDKWEGTYPCSIRGPMTLATSPPEMDIMHHGLCH